MLTFYLERTKKRLRHKQRKEWIYNVLEQDNQLLDLKEKDGSEENSFSLL